MKFVCIRDCFWDTLIVEGEVKDFQSENEIPPSVRPYFKTLEEVKTDKEEKELASSSEDDVLKALQAEADTLGMSYDGRWSAETLAFKIKQAKKGMS